MVSVSLRPIERNRKSTSELLLLPPPPPPQDTYGGLHAALYDAPLRPWDTTIYLLGLPGSNVSSSSGQEAHLVDITTTGREEEEMCPTRFIVPCSIGGRAHHAAISIPREDLAWSLHL